MILTEAIEFTKQFPSYQPKIFAGFVESRNGNLGPQGYVVLTTLTNESFSPQMNDYILRHKLLIERFRNYWVIYRPT
jgi:hypothetical protein